MPTDTQPTAPLPCGCGSGENCGECLPETCRNMLPCNRGVPNSDYEEACGRELCEHGHCSRCDSCGDCIDLKCHGCGVIYPNACQCPKGAEDDIAF